MALFQSGNPTLSQKMFDRSRTLEGQMQGTMTVRGTINKFGFLLFMVIAGAAYTWNLFYTGRPETMMTLFWVGLIGGLVSALVISFKPNLAKWLAPAYAILEGLVLGGLSAIINDAMSEKYPNIVMQAVALTFGVAIVVFLLYNFRIIQPTQKFKAVIITATIGILLLYGVYWIVAMFGGNISFMQWGDKSMLGLGINLFVAVIAALCLILDFERIEVGADMGAPKQMEWYGAFGLLVTMVWLYIQILQLLSRFSRR
jgi:uncharacterized YccA/Bax inhibitor family protein